MQTLLLVLIGLLVINLALLGVLVFLYRRLYNLHVGLSSDHFRLVDFLEYKFPDAFKPRKKRNK